jgi:hypothetical protein
MNGLTARRPTADLDDDGLGLNGSRLVLHQPLLRIQWSWLGHLIVLAAIGCVVGPLGIGSSRWELAAFAVVLFVLYVPVILRALRPSTRLVDSTYRPCRPDNAPAIRPSATDHQPRSQAELHISS